MQPLHYTLCILFYLFIARLIIMYRIILNFLISKLEIIFNSKPQKLICYIVFFYSKYIYHADYVNTTC
jgi:hypothetical protein